MEGSNVQAELEDESGLISKDDVPGKGNSLYKWPESGGLPRNVANYLRHDAGGELLEIMQEGLAGAKSCRALQAV